MPPLQVALSLVGIVVVMFGAYYVTYYIGVKSSGMSRGKNRNINMLDRFAFARDKSFCVVEIAGKVYIVGVTNQSMTLLDTIDAEAFARYADEHSAAGQWQPASGKPLDAMSKGLASFLANMTGKSRGKAAESEFDDKSFEERFRDAQEKASGQPEDPEGDR